jgi:pyridoxal phosphate enzyme (YggS family)
LADLEQRYAGILSRIRLAAERARRDPVSIVLIAVSKTQSADSVEALYRLGHRDFGENYVQELVQKAEELERRGCQGIRWHMIGHLQTNKVKQVLPFVSAIPSVDSLKLAQEISKRAATLRQSKVPIFLEVNLEGESTKSGVAPSDVRAWVDRAAGFESLDLQGLMCIPRPVPGGLRGPFDELRRLEESLRPLSKGQLSMGMSDDFELAIECGATHVRVGTALFGPRKPVGA